MELANCVHGNAEILNNCIVLPRFIELFHSEIEEKSARSTGDSQTNHRWCWRFDILSRTYVENRLLAQRLNLFF